MFIIYRKNIPKVITRFGAVAVEMDQAPRFHPMPDRIKLYTIHDYYILTTIRRVFPLLPSVGSCAVAYGDASPLVVPLAVAKTADGFSH